jgi:hypothetical protein
VKSKPPDGPRGAMSTVVTGGVGGYSGGAAVVVFNADDGKGTAERAAGAVVSDDDEGRNGGTLTVLLGVSEARARAPNRVIDRSRRSSPCLLAVAHSDRWNYDADIVRQRCLLSILGVLACVHRVYPPDGDQHRIGNCLFGNSHNAP